MRANKIGIVLEKTNTGKYNIQVVGINGDRVVASVSDIEELGVSFATASRVIDRLWSVIKLRLNRGELEFVAAKDSEGDSNDNEMGRL